MESSQTPTPTTAAAPQQTQEAPATAPAQGQAQSTNDLLQQIITQQEQHRAEVAALREQIDAQKQQPAPQQAPATNLSPEDALKARMEEVGKHDFYCPGCGLLYSYQQRCTGKAESPHPAIEVVSTDELKAGDEAKYTKPEYVNQ